MPGNKTGNEINLNFFHLLLIYNSEVRNIFLFTRLFKYSKSKSVRGTFIIHNDNIIGKIDAPALENIPVKYIEATATATFPKE